MIEYICMVDDHGDLVPTMNDGYELVRCKDCYAYEHQKGDSFGVCKVWMNNTAEDGYCHQGERDETD